MTDSKWRLEQFTPTGWRLITHRNDEIAYLLHSQSKFFATLTPYVRDQDHIPGCLIWDFDRGHQRPFDSLEEAASAAYQEFVRRIDQKAQDWPYISEGYGAFKQQIPFTDNPYLAGSANHVLWSKGWTMAGLNPFEE